MHIPIHITYTYTYTHAHTYTHYLYLYIYLYTYLYLYLYLYNTYTHTDTHTYTYTYAYTYTYNYTYTFTYTQQVAPSYTYPRSQMVHERKMKTVGQVGEKMAEEIRNSFCIDSAVQLKVIETMLTTYLDLDSKDLGDLEQACARMYSHVLPMIYMRKRMHLHYTIPSVGQGRGHCVPQAQDREQTGAASSGGGQAARQEHGCATCASEAQGGTPCCCSGRRWWRTSTQVSVHPLYSLTAVVWPACA